MQSLHKNKKRNRILFIIIGLIGILLINPFNIISSIRDFSMIITTPLLHAGNGIGQKINVFTHIIFDISDLYKENQELYSTVRRLESENADLYDVRNENISLRQSINLLPRDEYSLIGAEVIMRDTLGGNQWVTINKGKDSDITEGMAVVVDDKVMIGYVESVDAKTSRVILLTHPNSIVNVVGVQSGVEGLARGNHGLSVIVEDLKKDTHIDNGEMFITSEISGRFPRGLSIGHIQNIALSEDQLFQRGTVTPLLPFSDLHVVFIVHNTL